MANKRNASPRLKQLPLDWTHGIGAEPITSPLPADSQSQPINLSFVTPTDVVSKYLEVANDVLCRRYLVYQLAMRCESAQRIVAAFANNIASRTVQIRKLVDTPQAENAKRRVSYVLKHANGQDLGGWRNFVTGLIRSTFFSVTGAFIPFTLDQTGRIVGIKIIDPTYPLPYWQHEVEGVIRRLYEQDETVLPGQPVGIWYRDGSCSANRMFVLQRTQYVQSVIGSVGVGAFITGMPPAEVSLWSLALETAIMDALRHGANANDPAQIVVLNNVDMRQLQKAIQERQDALAAKSRGERVEEDKLRRRLVVTNQARDTKASVDIANFRTYPEGIKISELLTIVQENIALNFGARSWRVAVQSQGERFGNATNVATLNADEPGMRLAETIVMELIEHVIGPDSDLIAAEYIGVDNARNMMQADYDIKIAQTASQILTAVGPQGAAQYLHERRLIDPRNIKPVEQEPALALPEPSSILSRLKVHTLGTLAIDLKRKDATQEDYLQCALMANARYQEWIDNELPTVIDGFGLNRSELAIEVRDITNELATDLVRCAMRYGDRQRDTRMRLEYDKLRNRMMTLFGIPTQRGNDTTFPKINLFNALLDLSAPIAAGRMDAEDLKRVAMGFAHHIDRYYRSASGLVYVRNFPLDYDGPIEWVLDDLADHCTDCERIHGKYESVSAMLRASNGRYPRSIDLACFGHCKCHLRKAE